MEPPHLRIVLKKAEVKKTPVVEKLETKAGDATTECLKIVFDGGNNVPLFVQCLETLSKVSL